MEPKQNFLERFWYLFVIVAVILIGVTIGLWIGNQRSIRVAQVETTPPVVQEEIPQQKAAEIDQATADLEAQGESDEIEEIEFDIQNTDLSGIDQELTDIEKELSSE